MAARTLATTDAVLVTALGGTLTDADTITIGKYGVTYTDGHLRDSTAGSTTRDLLRVTLAPDFRGSLQAANGGQLRCIVDQTSTGYLEDKSNASAVDIVSDSTSANIYDIRIAPVNGHPVTINTADVEVLFQFGNNTTTLLSALDLATAYCTHGKTVIQSSANALTALHAGGNALVTLQRDVANIYAEGSCVITIDDTSVSPSGAAYLRGGTIKWRRGGTCADIVCNTTGTADFSELSEPITISTRHMGPGSTLILSKNGIQPTFSATADIGGGPRIVYV